MVYTKEKNSKYNMFIFLMILSAIIQISFEQGVTTIPSTLITTIPSTLITTIPSTIITTIPTTIVSKIPSTLITTIPTTIVSKIPSTLITTIPSTIITTIPTQDESNSTIKYTPKSSGGLSAGEICAIVIPCVAALGVAGAAALLFGRSAKTPIPVTMDSTMGTINTQPPITTVNNIAQIPNPVKEVQVIQPSPVVQEHPIYPVNKQPQIFPDVVQINVSGQNISQVSKKPLTNTRHIILGSQNQLMSPKIVSNIQNSQVISSNIPANVVSSQITTQSQAVPVKVLPVVEQGNI